MINRHRHLRIACKLKLIVSDYSLIKEPGLQSRALRIKRKLGSKIGQQIENGCFFERNAACVWKLSDARNQHQHGLRRNF